MMKLMKSAEKLQETCGFGSCFCAGFYFNLKRNASKHNLSPSDAALRMQCTGEREETLTAVVLFYYDFASFFLVGGIWMEGKEGPYDCPLPQATHLFLYFILPLCSPEWVPFVTLAPPSVTSSKLVSTPLICATDSYPLTFS